MPCRHTLALAVESTDPLFVRFFNGFDAPAGNATAQAPHLPNHATWTLGHCALTMNRVSERLLKDGHTLPADYFIEGDGTQGNQQQYDTESVCIGSIPTDNSHLYPPIERGLEVYQSGCVRFADAIRGVEDDAVLDKLIPWHDGDMPLWKLILRVCFHNASHAGQIMDLRRALGMERVIKAS